MYKRNNEGRLRNHYCRVKVISISYYFCVCVALIIQNAKRMCRIVF